jgi:hypothetical protein
VDPIVIVLVVSLLLLNFVIVPLLGLRLSSRRRLARETGQLQAPVGARSAGSGLRTDGYASVLLSRLVVQTCRVLAVERACLLVADRRDPDRMIAVAAHGLDENVIGDSVTVGGPLQSALRSGTAQHADASGLLPAFGPGTAVAMPAASARRLVLCVATDDPELHVDERDLALLGWLARLCAAALEDWTAKDRLDSRLGLSAGGLVVRDLGELARARLRIDVPALAARLGTRLALDPAALIELDIAARASQIGGPGIAGRRSSSMITGLHGNLLQHAERLARVPGLEVVALIVRFIPERWDGLGPQGLSGHRIPLASRILAACNKMRIVAANHADAATAVETALRRIQAASGSIFDPTVVAALTHELSGEVPRLEDDTTVEEWARADAQYAAVR